MTPPDHNQGKPQSSGEQAPATNKQDQPANRTASRRRWIKAVGLAAVPLIITIKAQPAYAQKGNTKQSHYPK
jgi:hypothetical protein